MALTGTYQRALDDKQRLAIPKRLRDAMGDAVVAREVGELTQAAGAP
jgi:DNA-binding transcriptional regulator/RsmH inhibitor MraZ